MAKKLPIKAGRKSTKAKAKPKAKTKAKAAPKKAAKAAARKKPVAKKAVKKPAAAKKSVAKKTAAKKSVGKKSAVKKSAAKKPAARKTTVKKVAAKKPLVKTAKATKSAKPAVRKGAKPGPKPRVIPSVDSADTALTAYTLPELVKKNGEASEYEVLGLIDTERSELLTLGAAVVTSRIATDAARLYGQATDFLRIATDEQRKHLIGISRDFLRIACWSALHGTELQNARAEGLDSRYQTRSRDKTEAGVLRHDGMVLREQIFRALRVLAGGKSTRIAEVEIGYGTAADGTELAKSLRSMSLVGRRFLKDPTLKSRAAMLGINDSPFTEAEQLAGQLSQKADLADAVHPPQGEVSQADVDLWDGINLTLLRHTIEIFAAAHSRNASIPRLSPIALRTAPGFRATPSRKAATPAPAPRPSLSPTADRPSPA